MPDLVKKWKESHPNLSWLESELNTEYERQRKEQERQQAEYERRQQEYERQQQYSQPQEERVAATEASRNAQSNALTQDMEARRQQAAGVNRAPNAYQTAMMQAMNATPAQQETRSNTELRRDANRQALLAAGTTRMAADMGGQLAQDQSLIYNPTYTANLRTMGQTMDAQQNKAAQTQAHYQTVKEQRKAEEAWNKYSPFLENPDFVEKSKPDLSNENRVYYSMAHSQEAIEENGANVNAAAYATDDEKRMFYYLWNTQGSGAANAYYYNYVEQAASARKAVDVELRTAARVQNNSFLGDVRDSFKSIGTNAISGIGIIDIALQNIGAEVSTLLGLGDPGINYYSLAQMPGLVTDSIRSNVAKKIAESTPGLTIGKAENAVNVAAFLYETGMSMADSTAMVLMNLAGVPEWLTLANMGTAAGTRAVRDAKERGASDWQALAFGISSAIMEALFEKASLDSILKPSNGKFFKNAAKQTFVEGSEEFFTTWGNTMMDQIIMGDKSELFTRQRQLMEQGYSQQDALKKAALEWCVQIGSDAIAGMLSGFGMGGAKEVGTGARLGVQNAVEDLQSAHAINDAIRQDRAAQAQNIQAPQEVQPTQAPVLESQQNQNARQADPLGYALQKAQNGEALTLNDGRAIIENPQALQALRDAGVLTDEVKAGKEGRQQVNAAVEALAAQEIAQTAQEETRQAETEPEPPAPQRAAETPTEGKLRITAAEQSRTEAPPVPSRLTIRGANATVEENRQEVDNNVDIQPQAQAASDSEGNSFYARARQNAAGRQGSNRSERASGVGRLLEDLRTTQAIRGAKSRAGEARSLRTEAEAGNQREVSAQDLGVRNGTEEKTARLLANDFAAQHLGRDWTRAVEAYAQRGVALQAMTGQIQKQTPEGISNIRAFVSGDGKTITVQADHPVLSWNQLLDHEELHRRIKEDAAYRQDVENALLADETLKPRLSEIIDRYYEAYRGVDSSMTSEDIYEELLADYRAGFDMLDPLGLKAETRAATKAAAKDIRAVEKKSLEKKVENSRPVSVSDEDKASREFDAKYMQAAIQYNDQHNRVPASLMDDVAKVRETIKEKMAEIQDVARLPEDVAGNTYFKNGSYNGSEETTTVCPRSVSVDALADAVGDALGRPLTIEETVYIAQQAFHFTDVPQCLYCYVAMDRMAKRQLLGEYINKRTQVYTDLENGMSRAEALAAFKARETSGGKQWSGDKQKRFDLWYRNFESGAPAVRLSNLSSEAAVENALSDYSLKAETEDALKYAQNASWAKKRVGFTAYNNHILKWDQKRINDLNSMFGLRLYSFSDYSPAYILENMQMVTDAAVRGLKMLAYTKELDFVRIFAGTGMNINVSTFGMDGGDGTVHMDAMQGADWKEAQNLREKFPNVGVTFVATNDNQVNWALDQDWIDVVIPFHMVKTGATVADILGYKNYTSETSDKKIAGLKAKQKEIFPNQHQNDKQKYLDALKKANLTPRFERWMDNPNYMKLDNETRRSAQDTPAVQPKFDQEAVNAALKSLDDMVKRGGYGAPIGGSLDNLMDIAEEMSDEIRKGIAQDLREHNRQKGKASTEIDTDYLAAVNSGDMETAQRMVDEAAKKAGYTIRAYHGTGSKFTVFDKSKIGSTYSADSEGFFFSSEKKVAEYAASDAAYQSGGEERVLESYLRMDDPLELTTKEDPANYYDKNQSGILQMMHDMDHDGIIIHGKDADMYVVLDSEQVKSADPVTYDDDGNVIPLSERFNTENEDIRYSLEIVDPIQPVSGKWQRGATYDEVKAAHPTLFELAADEAETRNPTQINGTVKTYRKIYDMLKQEGFDGTILDASSGLGYGTRAGRDEYGYDVDDIEPFPDKSYSPKYTDYSKLKKTYDVVISNAVLNVIPQDLRDAMVVKIGEMLNPGGRAFINVRGTDVKNAKSKVAINEDQMEYFIADSGSYQKGFRQAELVDYLKDALGDGFTVTPNSSFGGVSAVVTKNGGSASIEIDPEVAAMFSPEAIALREQARGRRSNPNSKRRVSNVRSNTYEVSGLFNEVEAQMDEADESNYEYDPISEKRSMREALGRLKADFDGEVSKLSEPDYDWGGSDLDTAMGILHRYRTEGRATGDYGDFWRWSKVIQEKGTKGGQFIQAFAKYTRTGTGAAMKGAKDIHDRFKLNPAQQKQVDVAKKKLLDGIDGDMNGAARDAMQQAKGQKEPGKKQDGKVDKKKLDAEVQRRKDAERLVREISKLFEKQQNRGEPVENWLNLTGEELARKIAGRFSEPKQRTKTTMQTILSDLVGFAEEHALPDRKKAEGTKRTAIDIITDYLNNRDAYGTAWAAAQSYLRAAYTDDPEKLDALEGFLGATIAYNAEGTDRTMLDAILQSADVLGISEKRILELITVGETERTIDRIGDELVSQVKDRMGADWQEEFGQQLKDAVRRHIVGIGLSESTAQQSARLGRMWTDAAKQLDIDLQKILTESRLTKQDAARRVADYLITRLNIPASDAAIAAQRISESFMDELAARADRRLQQMFGEKTTKAREQRDRLLDLIRLGGLTNSNVEDAVVDALGIGGMSRERQRELVGAMAQFGETLDAMEADDLDGLRDLIRAQAAVRNTPLSRQAEKTLAGETDARYLREFALAQLDAIAGDFAEMSPGAKISTTQTISHLLNMRTALRNLTSNQVFDLVDSAANNLATIPDMVIGAFTGKRTVGVNKSWLSEMKRAGAKQGAARNALEVRLDVSPDDRQKSKYGTAGRRTNSMAASNAFGRLLSHLEEVMGYELNTTDEFHKGSVRGETLESLARFVERGDITQEQANAWAEEEALYRSFQDDTLVGNFMGDLKTLLNTLAGFGGSGKTNSRGRTIHDFGLGDLVVKYTQVPGALIHRGIEYSPLGYAKMLYDLAIAKDSLVRTQRRGEDVANAQRKLALDIGRATTGSGLITLFAVLAKAGLLRRDDDDKDKNAKSMHAAQGLSGTQLNLTALKRWIEGGGLSLTDGDVLADIGFLEPLDSLMTIATLLAKDKDLSVSDIGVKSLDGVWKAISNTSAMQTISNIIQTVQYHDEENDLPLYFQIPIEIASDSISGFVPSPVRQLAQATDTTYRDQYRSKNINDQIRARFANSIPGVRQMLAPKITPLGEDKKYQKPVLNYFNATLNPGNVNVYQGSGVVDELNRVYGETDDAKIWPERNAPYSFTANGEKWTLTPDERTQFQRTRGQTTAALMQELITTPEYTALDAAAQAVELSWLGNYANYLAKQEMLAGRGVEYSSDSYEPVSSAVEAGISIVTYRSYKAATGQMTADKDENGKTIDGSKKKKVVGYIAGLNLTRAQKDYLYFEAGYAESTLTDTPWHKGGGGGSGKNAPARIPTLRIPTAPKVEKPSSGLRITARSQQEAARPSGLKITARAK